MISAPNAALAESF